MLEEALQMIYDDNLDPEGIYIKLPEANTFTGVDSGEEDDKELADNINRNQLQARTEIALKDSSDLEDIKAAEKENKEIFEVRPGKENITWIK
ncbi:hypothetical protein ILUMI_13360 [Ignelater luminosus]|uniref:Uncharacterized protein n=1 Tax=Ignelater luminosus TaxID=2038154 RepID=A0A8K0CWW4_IGNLU|nr:hypothetical protein ILUMI_13360 [Ignelater luminosus]